MHVGQSDFRKNIILFLAVFLLLTLIIIGVGIWYVDEQKKVVLEHYQVEAQHHVEGRMNRVQRFYKQGIGMLLALARNRSLNAAVAGHANARREVAEVFRDVMEASDMYDQIRLLDSAGRETVRVERTGDSGIDHAGDRVRVVPSGQLQNKGARYYVRRALALSGGAVYVSPFDLNMEHGKVQRPYKSMIRFATPVVDNNGIRIGVVIINMPGNSLMQRELSETVLEGEHLLINGGSPYWFDRHTNQLHVLEGMNNVVQAHRFPEGWLRVLKEDKGRYATAEGQFTVESMPLALPDMAPKTLILPRWQIVSFVPAAVLNAATDRSVTQTRSVCAIAIALLAAIIWLWFRHHIMKRMAMQTIRRSEARLKLAENNAQLGHWDWDIVNDDVEWSDGVYKLLGLQSNVAPSFEAFINSIHPDDREAVKASLNEALHGGVQHKIDFRITRGDREIRVIHAMGEVIFGETALVRMFGIIHDITEQKHVELQREALLKSNRQLAQGLIQAREDERIMLARALHDDIGQKLTAIQMQASAVTGSCLNRNCPGAPEAIAVLKKIQSLSSDLIETIRNQLKQLRPPQLDELGLKAALVSMCQEWQASSGVDCCLRVSDALDALDALDDDVCLNFYRIVQETLTNIARHAEATEAYVNLSMKEDSIHLTIRDNGCGFDPDAQTDGIGLIGMRERMELLGGSMRIESSPGKETRLIFRIPPPMYEGAEKTDQIEE